MVLALHSMVQVQHSTIIAQHNYTMVLALQSILIARYNYNIA